MANSLYEESLQVGQWQPAKLVLWNTCVRGMLALVLYVLLYSSLLPAKLLVLLLLVLLLLGLLLLLLLPLRLSSVVSTGA
jgi:hypothetical protein